MSYDPRYVTTNDGHRHGEVVGAERTPNGKLLVEWNDQARTWHPRNELLRDTERPGTVDIGQDTGVPLRVACQLTVDAHRPEGAHPGDAGLDLRAVKYTVVHAGDRELIDTGVRLALPAGYAALVTPRSGLALRDGVTVLNAPGLIDSGYRGTVGVILHNTDRERGFIVAPGDRIAQLVIIQVPAVELFVVDTLPVSVRAEGGFGSTGT